MHHAHVSCKTLEKAAHAHMHKIEYRTNWLIPLFKICTAAENGHRSVVELLLEAGANCCTVDTARMTPLHYACMGGSEPCAKLLLETNSTSGVSVDAKDISGCTPLVYCLNHKSRSMEMVCVCVCVCAGTVFLCTHILSFLKFAIMRKFQPTNFCSHLSS